MSTIFERQYQGAPKAHNEHWAKLRQLAKQYVESCEAFDRTVCTGPIKNGAIMPRTPDEYRLIAQNARVAAEQLRRQARDIGATPEEVRRARMDAEMELRRVGHE